jgi:hypothetical protein
LRLESFRIQDCFGFVDSDEITLGTPGNLVYFLGRNSSGKTSVLRSICHFEYGEVPEQHPNFLNYERYGAEPMLRAYFSVDASSGWTLSVDTLVDNVMERVNSTEVSIQRDENGFAAGPSSRAAPAAVKLLEQVKDEYLGLVEAIQETGKVWIEKLGDGSYIFLTQADDYADFNHRHSVITGMISRLRTAFQNDGWKYPEGLDFAFIEGLLFKQFPEIFFFTERFSLNDDLPRSIRDEHLSHKQNALTEAFMDLLDKSTLQHFLHAAGRRRIGELEAELQAKLDTLCSRINEDALAGATDELVRIFVDRHNGIRVILDVDGKESYYEHLSDNTKFLIAYHIFQDERERKNTLPSVLLFDEPNQGFHPSAERKMLRFLESLGARGNQVLMATHSQHMIDLDRLSAVRIMTRTDDGTLHVDNRLYGSSRASRDTLALQPITDAIGLRYADQLVTRDKVIITEGYTELLYFRHFARLLGYDEPNLAPVTGDGKILTFMSFLISQGISFKVALDSSEVKDRIKVAVPLPDDSVFVVEERLAGKAGKTIGIEDLISKDDFRMLLHRCGHVTNEIHLGSVSNSEYAKSTGVKALVAREV